MNSIMSIENYIIGEVVLKLDITDNVIVDILKEDIEKILYKIYKENGLTYKNDLGLFKDDGYTYGEIIFKFEKGTENLSEVLICLNGHVVNIEEFKIMTIEEIKETEIYDDSLKALRNARKGNIKYTKENIDTKIIKLMNKYKDKSILNNVIGSLILRKDDQECLDSFNQLIEIREDLNKEIRYCRLNIIKEYGELYLYSKTIEDIENICNNNEEEIYKSLEDIENEMNNISDHINELSDQLYTKIITLGLIEDIKNAYTESVFDNKEEK